VGADLSDEKPTNYWTMEVGSLVRLLRERQGAPVPEASPDVSEEVSSPEARLRVVPRDGRFLDFYSTLSPRRLFSLAATLAGPLSKFTQVEAAAGRRVVVGVPLALSGGERVQVKVTLHLPRGVEPGQDLELTRAGQGKLPPDTRLLEFLFCEGENEFRYVVELHQRIDVLDFEEVVDQRPVFLSVPPVAQMTAFLRAITQKRRTALDILKNLKAQATPQAVEAIRALKLRTRPHQELAHPGAQTLHRLLEASGRIVSLQALMAFALFADMEAGCLTSRVVEDSLQTEQVPLTADAILLVSEHFGLELEPATWAEEFPFFGDSLDAVRARSTQPALIQVREKLRQQRDRRTPLEILEQIAQESNSRRAAAFAEGLKQRLPEGRIGLNDEQLALLALLSAAGRRYQANTLVALCLFVDAEVGFLSEADLENLSRSSETVDTSMYAMVAVAGAFEVQLRGLVLEESEHEPVTRSLPALVGQSQAGLLGGFRMPGRAGHHWHWIRSPEEGALALQDGELEFTRMVLGSFPILDQLSEPDLAVLADSGHDLVAVFQSDLDRSLVWRRLGSLQPGDWRSPAPDGRRTSFSFVEGFSAFHFSRLVLAGLRKVEDAELVGCQQVVAVYLDNRQNRHFRHLSRVESTQDLEPPPNSGLEWSHQVVWFPDVSGLPGIMRELGQDALLGRTDTLSTELRNLEWIHEALWQVLTRPVDHQSLMARPDLLERVRKTLWSSPARDILASMIDARTHDDLNKNLREPPRFDFRLYRPLLEGGAGREQLEFAGLRIMYEMCRSELVGSEGYFKHYDAARFRAVIHNRLMEMLESPDPSIRAMAMRLLATAEEVPETSMRLVVEYELSRALADPEPAVGRAAAEGLLRLCLMDKVPLPEMVDLVQLAVDEVAEPVEDEPLSEIPGLDPDELRRVEVEIRNWFKSLTSSDPKRALSFPLAAPEGNLRADLLKPLVEILASLNCACQLDGSLFKRRYFAVVSSQELERLRGAWLDSWKVMALSLERRLSELVVAENPAELFLDYQFFVEDHAAELKSGLGASPYLTGPDQPRTVYHLPPGEPAGVFRRRGSSFVSEVLEESRLFLDLVELLATTEPQEIRILRLAKVGGMTLEEFESHLPVFTLTRPADLRTAEVLQNHRLRFGPLLHELAFSREQVGPEEQDLEDLQSLLALFQGRKPAVSAQRPVSAEEQSAVADEHLPPAETKEEPAPEEPASSEESSRDAFRRLAAEIAQAFGMPEETERQILNMLMVVGRRSLYDL